MKVNKNKNKAIFFVSLNSKLFEEFLEIKHTIVFDEKIDVLDLFVFDIFEVLNGIFFNANTVQQQNQIIEGVISRIAKEVVPFFPIISGVQRHSEMQVKLGVYIAAVYQEYYTNSSFKRNCRSQIFKNLHPKLVSLGIERNKDPLVEILAPFLLVELAVYLYIFHTGEYTVAYGLEAEMEVIAAIKSGKYPAFTPFLLHPIPHHKIFLQQQ
jgi:hypothetical protein